MFSNSCHLWGILDCKPASSPAGRLIYLSTTPFKSRIWHVSINVLVILHRAIPIPRYVLIIFYQTRVIHDFFFAFDWNTSLHPPKRGYSWLIMQECASLWLQDKILEQNQIDDQNVALQGCQIQAARGKTRLILVPFYINYILVEWCSSIPDKTHIQKGCNL